MEAQLPTSTLRYRALSLKRNDIEKDIGLGNDETLVSQRFARPPFQPPAISSG
jgi:hypothetical protein